MKSQPAAFDELISPHVKTASPRHEGPDRFVKRIKLNLLPLAGGERSITEGQRGLAGPRRPHDERTGSTVQTASKQGVQTLNAGRKVNRCKVELVGFRLEARKDDDSLLFNDEVMKPFAEFYS